MMKPLRGKAFCCTEMGGGRGEVLKKKTFHTVFCTSKTHSGLRDKQRGNGMIKYTTAREKDFLILLLPALLLKRL